MKVLLALMPFWSPMLPPMGLACLKSFLNGRGFDVTAVDVNTDEEFRKIYDDYIAEMRLCVPADKQGNFLNTAFLVWEHHMLAHWNAGEKQAKEQDYVDLVKLMVYDTYYVNIGDHEARRLIAVVERVFQWLDTYVNDLLEREKPDVLGLSVYTCTLAASLFAFKMAKRKLPGVRTVMGGGIFSDDLTLGSPNMDYFLEETKDIIDCIIMGEGEDLFLKYLQGRLPADRRVHSLQDPGAEPLDFASVRPPDFSGFQLEHYPSLASYSSRSCPFQCSFCNEAAMWGKFRKREPGKIAQELVDLHKTYGSRLIFMCDSLLNPVIDSLSREMENVPEVLYFDGYLRADKHVCDLDNTIRWRQAGYYRARLGLESGSPKILEAMGKKITPVQIKEAVRNLAEAGIKTTTFWVIGYPGETEEDFQHTLDVIEDLKDDIYQSDCNPFLYFPSGQYKSDEWASKHQCRLLYPEKYKELLMIQTWYIDCEPQREVIYDRIRRFTDHCKKLGIPDPYTMQEIHEADLRWKKLHKNAVPSLMELMESKGKAFEDERREVKKIIQATEPEAPDDDWGF